MESLSMGHVEDGDSGESVHIWRVNEGSWAARKDGSNWNDCQWYSSPEKHEEETQPYYDGTQVCSLIHLE